MLNLVHPDWRKILQDYPVHRLHVDKQVSFSRGHACHVDKAYVKILLSLSIPTKSLWWLTCRVIGPNLKIRMDFLEIIAKECPPLTMIGEAMRETVQQKLHDAARLFKETCSPVLCNTFKTAHQRHHIPCDVHRNWCVMTTRKFDGENLTNAFKKQLEPILEGIGTFFSHLSGANLQSYENWKGQVQNWGTD
ncbi:uncharacterized protein TNCV_3849851 [Trichonephila clavipes]|nr:uncharacterized protein TNCV_3849851 [Trichonephila clavipes]